MTAALLQSLESLVRGQRLTRDELDSGLWSELRALGVPVAEGPTEALGFDVAPELLDAAEIRAHGLPDGIEIECRLAVASTNADLVETFRHRYGLLAECQSGGRGRQGRRWLSPFAGGLWFSCGYRFAVPVERLGPLTLAVGVALAETLELPQLRLKWPNDLIVEDAKLGGILVEARSAGGGTEAVIGVGINLRPGFDRVLSPDQPWTTLERLVGGPVARNRLAARLLGAVDRACQGFERDGFAPLLPAWARLDALAGRAVRVERGAGPALLGRANGVGDDGLLRVIDAEGVEHRVASGEVRVRGL